MISPELIRRVSIHLEKGAEHYGADNWRAGMPFRRVLDSLIRHIFQYAECDEVEDHLAAIVCNTMFLMEYEAQGKSLLDDRYREPEKNPEKNLTHAEPDAKLKQRPDAEQMSWHMDQDGRLRHGARHGYI